MGGSKNMGSGTMGVYKCGKWDFGVQIMWEVGRTLKMLCPPPPPWILLFITHGGVIEPKYYEGGHC